MSKYLFRSHRERPGRYERLSHGRQSPAQRQQIERIPLIPLTVRDSAQIPQPVAEAIPANVPFRNSIAI
jgi:hypothetical protein